MTKPIPIFVVREMAGWGAASPELPDFLLTARTCAEIEARLANALRDHCGQAVAFEIILPRAADLD